MKGAASKSIHNMKFPPGMISRGFASALIESVLENPRSEEYNRPKEQPDSGDPVPVKRCNSDVAGVFLVEAFAEYPGQHDAVLASSRDQVSEMHPQDEPNDRAVRILIPAEMQ